MRALLAIGGEGPERALLEPLLPGFGFVCAADSGLDLLSRWALEPDLVVGDMDSVSSPGLLASYPRAEVIRFPRDKDESDTELGLRLLFERGYREVSIAGGVGGAVDLYRGKYAERCSTVFLPSSEDIHFTIASKAAGSSLSPGISRLTISRCRPAPAIFLREASTGCSDEAV